jgi:hypothetical protein
MWEYKTEAFNSFFDNTNTLKEKSNKVLDAAGKEGWELINFQCAGAGGSMMIFVFKRLIK